MMRCKAKLQQGKLVTTCSPQADPLVSAIGDNSNNINKSRLSDSSTKISDPSSTWQSSNRNIDGAQPFSSGNIFTKSVYNSSSPISNSSIQPLNHDNLKSPIFVTLPEDKLKAPFNNLTHSEDELSVVGKWGVDTSENKNKHTIRKNTKDTTDSNIICIEAPATSQSFNGSEVDINVSYDKPLTPVKILCHKPKSNGFKTDSINSQHGSFSDFKSVKNDLVNSQNNTNKSILSNTEKNPSCVPLKENTLLNLSTKSKDSQDDFSKEKVVTNVSKYSESIKRKQTSYKIKSRYLNSQTKNSVKTPAGPIKAKDRSVLKKITTDKNNHLEKKVSPITNVCSQNSSNSLHIQKHSTPYEKSNASISLSGKTKHKKSSSNEFSHFASPNLCSSGMNQSTPEKNDLTNFSYFDIDQSNISAISGLAFNSTNLTTKSDSSKNNSKLSKSVLSENLQSFTDTCKNKFSPQSDLNLYVRYCQSEFLNAQAHQKFLEQETNVLNQIYLLFLENQKLKQELFSKQKSLTKMKHQINLDKWLNLQQDLLKDTVCLIPTLKQHYKKLATSIDSVRHQLPSSGLYLPNTEDDLYYQEFQRTLFKYEETLGKLVHILNPKLNSLSKCVSLLESTHNVLDLEIQEFEKCMRHINLTDKIVTDESSLTIQRNVNRL